MLLFNSRNTYHWNHLHMIMWFEVNFAEKWINWLSANSFKSMSKLVPQMMLAVPNHVPLGKRIMIILCTHMCGSLRWIYTCELEEWSWCQFTERKKLSSPKANAGASFYCSHDFEYDRNSGSTWKWTNISMRFKRVRSDIHLFYLSIHLFTHESI